MNEETPEKLDKKESNFKETSLENERLIEGAQMLENPPDGSFVHGLQLFIDWVQSLLAEDK